MTVSGRKHRMSNQFLQEIHQYLTGSILASQTAAKTAAQTGDAAQLHFHQGKLEELQALRAFLDAHINLTTQRYY